METSKFQVWVLVHGHLETLAGATERLSRLSEQATDTSTVHGTMVYDKRFLSICPWSLQ